MKKLSTLWDGRLSETLRLLFALQLAMLSLLASMKSSSADEVRFFRVLGPVPAVITDLTPDGTITWTNVQVNATFTVQTATALLGQSNWVDYIQVPVSNAVTIHQIFERNAPPGTSFIPAGSFTMGNTFPADNAGELPLHTVYVSAFYMDKYEVTKALWDDVYQWATNNGYNFSYNERAQGKTNNHPAQELSWYGAVKWCNARSEKEGKVPAYYTDTAQTTVYRIGQTNVQNEWVKWNAGYRLPTEAEWEKAARAGLSGWRFSWGETNKISHSRANYYGDYDLYDLSALRGFNPAFVVGWFPYTGPVGYFAANGYGLYDMTGNVAEWCWDWYGSYGSGSQTGPRGPTSGSDRLVRGGGWDWPASACRVAFRQPLVPSDTVNDLGSVAFCPQASEARGSYGLAGGGDESVLICSSYFTASSCLPSFCASDWSFR